MFQTQKSFKRIILGLLFISIILIILLSNCSSFRIKKIGISENSDENKANKLKIIHLSDIHIKNFNNKKHVEKLVKTINDLQGDIIVYTGDYGDIDEMKQGQKIFSRLKCSYKKYAVLGNHDYGDKEHAEDNWKSKEDKMEKEGQLKRLYKEWGVELLLNESDTLSFNNHIVAVIGIKTYDPHHGFYDCDLEKAINNINRIENKILLMHNPDFWSKEVVGKHNIKLTLAGHTHGGQIGIGFGDYKISPAQLMFSQWRGIYKKENEILIVNTGIGTYGLPFRICMDPEIILVILPLI